MKWTQYECNLRQRNTKFQFTPSAVTVTLNLLNDNGIHSPYPRACKLKRSGHLSTQFILL